MVARGGGAGLSDFSSIVPLWSIYRDFDYGFVKLTAFYHSNLLFEYKKSRDGKVLRYVNFSYRFYHIKFDIRIIQLVEE